MGNDLPARPVFSSGVRSRLLRQIKKRVDLVQNDAEKLHYTAYQGDVFKTRLEAEVQKRFPNKFFFFQFIHEVTWVIY